MVRLVIDTNVFVAGLRSAGGASRDVLRRALSGSYQPLFGNALWQTTTWWSLPWREGLPQS